MNFKTLSSEGVLFFGDFMAIIDFLKLLFSNFQFCLTVLITLAVAFVNGWTDAPNAIASSVATRCIPMRKAVLFAAFFDLSGALVMGLISGKVSETVIGIADFGADNKAAAVALCAAMCAVVIWATAAWAFGIPTSESHALLAGIMGASVAINRSFAEIDFTQWLKVGFGLVISTFLGFSAGFAFSKITVVCFKNTEKSRADSVFKRSQIAASAFMAFMHGAQDSQKFAGILSLVVALSANGAGDVSSRVWPVVLCSLAIALGTATGGTRIIKSVGMDMIKLRRDQGFSADMAGAICLLVSTVFGLPVSTTHTKTCAVLGVGAAKSLKSVDWSVAGEMSAAWILTFPGCALLGGIITLIFEKVML